MSTDAEVTLASLKDFQRDTVDYAFRRLWLDDDSTKRFLVADEVGLGKTMVAKGLIAKTIEHLQDTKDRIDIIYICSNTQIARQNLSRLNVVGASELKHADRLTLLPKVVRDLADQRINLISFTPGTSFNVGNSGGKSDERVLLFWMLAECWGGGFAHAPRWKKFFEGGVERARFQRHLKDFDRTVLDDQLCASFGAAIESTVGPEGGPLRAELEACSQEFNYMRGKPSPHLSWRRNQLVGALRHLVARAAIDHLEPDLVILDEFQRFKDVLESQDEGAELAQAIFNHHQSKVLLLSATPFKMYTLPDEPEGDDHFQDFNRTVKFLAGPERAAVVERELRTMRETLVAGGDQEVARAARDRAQHELRHVMCRTERLSSTPDRDGMLGEKALPGVGIVTQDLRAWAALSEVARHVKSQDVFEYWRSTPHFLNFMEQHSYQVRSRFQEEVERENPALVASLKEAEGLLDWSDVEAYREVDPGNAKLRGLAADVLDRGAWRLAWLPPSMPYYELAGAYAEPDLRSFTKRLIFSSWTVAPKAIAAMLSYDAERRAMVEAGYDHRKYSDLPITPPLQFRPAGTTLALLYPSPALAQAGDPLAIAREALASLPMDRARMEQEVRRRVRTLMEKLPAEAEIAGAPDSRWYWIAPALLDQVVLDADNASLLHGIRTQDQPDEDHTSRFIEHLKLGDLLPQFRGEQEGGGIGLGARPHDLEDVLVALAIGAPGVCALRALSRVTGGSDAMVDPDVRLGAFRIAQGLRSLFNKPEIIALLRAGDAERDESYWKAVLDHAASGGLQAVLDEYAHVLIESEGLQDVETDKRVRVLADTMSEALSMRAVHSTVQDIRVDSSRITMASQRMRNSFAARYGRAQSSDASVVREGTVRTAYNAPFRPFVLASTSVGQEGLDFHTYSHAIVHWNLPGNPVDLEQREGRVHRYKGHAVRKNVARDFAYAALGHDADPWEAVFREALAVRDDASSEVVPYWVYAPEGGAVIERYVPAMPLSRELQHYKRLQRTVVAYRQLLGQPRQDDLLQTVGADAEWLRIDLAPSSPNDALASAAPPTPPG